MGDCLICQARRTNYKCSHQEAMNGGEKGTKGKRIDEWNKDQWKWRYTIADVRFAAIGNGNPRSAALYTGQVGIS